MLLCPPAGWMMGVGLPGLPQVHRGPGGGGDGAQATQEQWVLMLGHDWLSFRLGQQNRGAPDRQTWLRFGLARRGAKLPHSITLQFI